MNLIFGTAHAISVFSEGTHTDCAELEHFWLQNHLRDNQKE